MNDEINQLDSIIDGTGTATDVTTGDTIDTVAHLGDGTLTAETYTLPSTTIGYNLLGTTGGTPNLDQFNRVQNMVWANYGTDATLDGFEYLRDTQGDVTQRINAVNAYFSELYQNDKLDQMTGLERGEVSGSAIADPTFTESFSPDGFGNQSSYQQTVDGGTTVDQTSTFGPTNQVQDFSGDGWAAPSFDAAGNATATPNPLAPTTGLNVQVDGWNNVTHVSNTSDSINVSYFYDALGNMIVRVNNLAASGTVSTTDIYYSGQQVLEEDPRLPASPASDAAAVAHQYVYSPRSINTPILDTQTSYTVVSEAWTSATATYYFLTDANDNVTSITDSNGAVQERYVYSAFGTTTIYNSDYSATRTVSSVNNTILFAGMMIDPETGIYKDGARFYSSITTSFLTPDPRKATSTPTGTLATIRSTAPIRQGLMRCLMAPAARAFPRRATRAATAPRRCFRSRRDRWTHSLFLTTARGKLRLAPMGMERPSISGTAITSTLQITGTRRRRKSTVRSVFQTGNAILTLVI